MSEWYGRVDALREEIEETQSEVINNQIRCMRLMDMNEALLTRIKKLEENK